MPKILADENIEAKIVSFLRQINIGVKYISEKSKGITDQQVLEIAKRGNLILLTNDRELAYKIYLENKLKTGIILLRFSDQQTRTKLEAIKKTLKIFPIKRFVGKFGAISENGIKVMT